MQIMDRADNQIHSLLERSKTAFEAGESRVHAGFEAGESRIYVRHEQDENDAIEQKRRSDDEPKLLVAHLIVQYIRLREPSMRSAYTEISWFAALASSLFYSAPSS